MGKNVSVVIPAYNESDCILRTLESLKGIDSIKEIIVVDDGSTDCTYKLLKPIRSITLLKNEYNRGKGSAVRHALNHVNNKYVALLDADICESASEIYKLIERLHLCEKSIIIGRLPSSEKKGGFGIVKGLSGKCFEAMTSIRVDSLLSGQRILPLDFIRSIELPSGFGLEFKITLEAVRKGYEVIEVPVNMRHRETGRNISGFIHRGKQCLDILDIIRNELK